MVIDKPGYEHLIVFLTDNLSIFENAEGEVTSNKTVMELIEENIASQLINLCTQHQQLETNHRSIIVREIDGIFYDLQEILSGVLDQNVTQAQQEFIEEYVGLIKNLFDTEVVELLD